jgi:lysophospholipase L1-like esterase
MLVNIPATLVEGVSVMGDLCFQSGQKVVLIGDSITDCGRRGQSAPLGEGYVSMLRDLVLWGWPERDITWVNKGIGGDRVTDLQSRWEDDVIREAPDWLSVEVGINDLHSHLGDPGNGVSPARFRNTYHEILTRAREKTTAGLVLIAPFYISSDDGSRVLELLPEYTSVVEALAGAFGARLVSLQPMFERQLEYRPPGDFCPEPVHPNRTGHLLIAQEILHVLCS